MEKYFYMNGYNKALDDVIALISTSDVGIDELVDILEVSKVDWTEVEL